MSSLLVAALLVVGAGDARAEKAGEAPKVEGKWLVAYAEEGSRPNRAWEKKVATVKGNTLTFEEEGKERSLRLTFGANQTLKASGGEGDAKKSYSGVYIAGQDYLCISLNPASGAGGGGRGTDGEEEAKEKAEPARGQSSGAFILILRRQRGD